MKGAKEGRPAFAKFVQDRVCRLKHSEISKSKVLDGTGYYDLVNVSEISPQFSLFDCQMS